MAFNLHNLAGRGCAWVIGLYRRFISPLKPRCCRFSPTCSEYAREAFLVHGFWKGLGLTLWRILRCHPFYHGNLNDPVPPRKISN
ncbi:MAG: membrane protein insertion efficiency factor YidD [Victivallales bacterium]|nr:membrane protein insertion efficiency factor YidD [Victivallales bacterium]